MCLYVWVIARWWRRRQFVVGFDAVAVLPPKQKKNAEPCCLYFLLLAFCGDIREMRAALTHKHIREADKRRNKVQDAHGNNWILLHCLERHNNTSCRSERERAQGREGRVRAWKRDGESLPNCTSVRVQPPRLHTHTHAAVTRLEENNDPKGLSIVVAFPAFIDCYFRSPAQRHCTRVCECARVLQFLLLLSLAEEQAAAAPPEEEEAEEAGICCGYPKPKNTTPHRPLKHTHSPPFGKAYRPPAISTPLTPPLQLRKRGRWWWLHCGKNI